MSDERIDAEAPGPNFPDALKASDAAERARQAALAPPPRPERRTNRSALAGYVESAIREETSALARMPPDSGRNDQLNISSFNLGTLVGAGALDRSVAEAELINAARACDMHNDRKDGGMSAVHKTLKSGLEAGMSKPRDMSEVGQESSEKRVKPNSPIVAEVNGKAATKSDEAVPHLVTVIKSTIASRVPSSKPMWVWEWGDVGRIQLGTMTVFAGKPGAGKSTALRWFAARLSKGELPGVWHGHPMNVAPIFIEEQRNAVVVPSLKAAGADMSRIVFPDFYDDQGKPRSVEIQRDEHDLTDWLIDNEIRALFIDPIMSTIGGGSDVNRNNEMREKLTPLTRMAEAINGIVVVATHLKKGENRDIMDAVHSSTAFVEVPRAVFGFAAAGDGEHILEQVKNNAGQMGLKLKYQLRPHYDVTDDGQDIELTRFHITGETEVSIVDINPNSDETTDIGQAKEWLKMYLLENQPMASAQIKIDAKKHGDIQPWTLKRAMKELHVRVSSHSEPGKPRTTVWALPDYAASH